MHTEYSKLDGFSKFDELIDVVVKDGAPALSTTEHGLMPGTIKAAQACKDAGIKYIPGLEAYVTKDRRLKAKAEEGKTNFHMLLFAKSNEGYKNLMATSSLSYTEGRYGKFPRADNQLLAEYSKDIIATTGCLGSVVNQRLLAGDIAGAEREAGVLLDIYGQENLFVEVQNHGIKDQLRILGDQVKLAKRMGLGLVATQDSHYTYKDDHYAHDAFICINTGEQIDNTERFKFEGSEHYVKTSAEMRKLFPNSEFPGACDNTLLIADMVDVDIQTKSEKFHFPRFPVELAPGVAEKCETKDELWAEQDKVTKKLLWDKALEGLIVRYGDEDGVVPKRPMEQLQLEYDTIVDMGYTDYFLVEWEAINWLKNRGRMVAPGRGSGAGAIINYSLNITSIDPIEHGLFFERFLNKGRKNSPPDIDSDVEADGRSELYAHAQDFYGHDRVANIATFSILKPKQSIKDAARVLGFSVAEATRISSWCTADGMTISDYLEESKKNIKPDNMRAWKHAQPLRNMYSEDAQAISIIDLAMDLEGRIRNMGSHAGGLVISPEKMWNYSAVSTSASSDFPVTQFDHFDAEKAGLIKYDFLVLTNLSTIRVCLELIRRDLGKTIDLDHINMDDKATYDLIASGDTDGLFQINKEGCTTLVKRVNPQKFSDLYAILALYRPGPMESDIHNLFADRKNGRAPIEVQHPDLLDILDETYGLIVYQEQVMQIARHFAGFDLVEADDFRSAMGKKDEDKMEQQRIKFFAGFKKNGYTEKLCQELWDIVKPFSKYAFNKSHSVAYGTITYWTAYLKTHYRTQFAAACIDTLGEDQVALQVASARNQGIQVYAPDVNRSLLGPATSKTSIWLGMAGISRCGVATVENIIAEREKRGEFESVEDFIVKTRGTGANKNQIENLALAGAFDTFGVSRKKVFESVPGMLAAGSKMGDPSDDDDLFGMSEMGIEMDTIMDSFDLTGEDYSDQEKLSYEMATLGFYVSKHPYYLNEELFRESLGNGTIPEGALFAGSELVIGDKVRMYGIVINPVTNKTKSGGIRSNFRMEAGSGQSTDCIHFGSPIDSKYEGQPVLLDGVVQEDTYGESSQINIRVNSVEIIKSDTRDVSPRTKRREARGKASTEETPGLRVIQGGAAEPKSRRKKPVNDDPPPAAAPPRERPSEKRQNSTSSARDRLAGRRTNNSSSRSDTCTFHARTEKQLVALRNELLKKEKGPTSVIIQYMGEEISHPELSFTLSLADIQDIELESGAVRVS